jgi:tetratricopeptide (TPR) repeat protein
MAREKSSSAKASVADVGRSLPQVKTVSGEAVNEDTLVSLSKLALMNNMVLRFVERGTGPGDSMEEAWRKDVREKGFHLRDIGAGGAQPRLDPAVSYVTVRAARDLKLSEYTGLIMALCPWETDKSRLRGKPLDEVIVEVGIRSLTQILDADPAKTSDPRTYRSLKAAIQMSKEAFEDAEKKTGIVEKTVRQTEALDIVKNAISEIIDYEVYPQDVRKTQSPKRTLHRLDAVCEQMTILADSIVRSIAPQGSGIRTFQINVLEDAKGVGIDHTCLLCRLADGSYYTLDASKPDANGRIPEEVLPSDSLPKPRRGTPITLILKPIPARGVDEPMYHNRIQLLPTADRMLCEQHNILGDVYTAKGETASEGQRGPLLAGAQREYTEALKINPDSVSAHNSLGDTYLQGGRLVDAEREYASTLRVSPRNMRAINGLGDVFSAMGRPEEAISQWQMSIGVQPLQTGPRIKVADILRRQGNPESAKEQLRMVLEISPTHRVAKDMLADLQGG